MAAGKSLLNIPLIGMVHLYRLTISPCFGPCCRFEPNCSSYALQAFQQYGPVKGCYLAFKRLMHCHPWHPGGMDPLP